MKSDVLIIDDDEMVVTLHSILLKEAGVSSNPFVAMDGKKALEYILKFKNEEHNFLLFLDINMPQMNGWEFLEELNKSSFNQRTKVVIVSSSVDKKDKLKSLEFSNVYDYVEKPLSLDYCINLRSTFN